MRYHAGTGAPARRAAGLVAVALVGALALALLAACGQGSSTAGVIQPTPTDTATPTFAPTATSTATPAPTQTPARMLVRVTPDPARCSASCAAYICTPPGGASCAELLSCTSAMSFPFFQVSNSGQLPLTWSWTITPTGSPGTATLTLAPNGGMVPGGQAVSVTLNADKNLATSGPAAFNIAFSGGGETTTVQAQCS
ncbi:MAG TPA: hypothetical protein VGR57_08370 [Ktedonobacterales bacterium]|nr:hypothetical protein [Ktedonobacterales bacterium]